jgi:CRISPR-associated endonuclease/helicase Cas3
MESIAHIRKEDKQIQTVEQHLLETKALAECYGEKLGIKYLAGLAGMLHDMGKYTTSFRDYILSAVHNPASAPKRGSVDHSTAGGKLLYEYFHSNQQLMHIFVAEVVGNAIFSHHSYLQDFITPDLKSNYIHRAKKQLEEFETAKKYFFTKVMDEQSFIQYVDRAAEKLKCFLTQQPKLPPEVQLMFLTKFIFSILIDADRTNTRLFEENGSQTINDYYSLWDTYYQRLMAKVRSFPANTPIHQQRSELAEQCEQFAQKPSGIYTLSIPTGGGKTLTSLRYALKHAKLHKKQRIVYVLPYTTIIEQNAKIVKEILQDPSHILEHHSNVIIEDEKDDEQEDGMTNPLKLAKDNWDVPIIFTTMVQFLNTFYASGTRSIRRLHQLSHAVIIFDEVQKVPIHCISLFNQALNFLNMRAHASIVLCTATQPALDFVEQKLELNPDAEMVKQLPDVAKAFKRVNIIDYATERKYNTELLADFVFEKMADVRSLLVILNTKSVVRKLYTLLCERKNDFSIFHLSTSMCAAHRMMVLDRINELLNSNQKVICISTPLIEAGVDISFECVIRSLAGLDSVAQAAGRCNRNGEREISNVYVIDHEEENLDNSSLKEVRVGKKVAKRILIDQKRGLSKDDDLLSQSLMNRYFKEFYMELQHDLNHYIPALQENMTELLLTPRNGNRYCQKYKEKHHAAFPLALPYSYHTAAKYFSVINHVTTSVLVPYKEKGREIITTLTGGHLTIDRMSQLFREAQPYIVNLYDYEVKQLLQHGAIVDPLGDGEFLVLHEIAYDDEYGVDIQSDAGFPSYIF